MDPCHDPNYFALLQVRPRMAKDLAKQGVATIAGLMNLEPGLPGVLALQEEAIRVLESFKAVE